MSASMEGQDLLTLGSLVTISNDIEPYVLEWPAVDLESQSEALVLVIHTRPGGLLLAAPIGFVPEEVLSVGNSPVPPGPVGPSTVLLVPGSVLDNGALTPTGSPLAVLVVDFSEAILPQLKMLPSFSNLHFTFDQGQPYAVPSPEDLLAKVREWLEGGGESTALGYVTAEQGGDLDGEALTDAELQAAGDLLDAQTQSTPPPTPKPKSQKPQCLVPHGLQGPKSDQRCLLLQVP